jgi:hypothetical protein
LPAWRPCGSRSDNPTEDDFELGTAARWSQPFGCIRWFSKSVGLSRRIFQLSERAPSDCQGRKYSGVRENPSQKFSGEHFEITETRHIGPKTGFLPRKTIIWRNTTTGWRRELDSNRRLLFVARIVDFRAENHSLFLSLLNRRKFRVILDDLRTKFVILPQGQLRRIPLRTAI